MIFTLCRRCAEERCQTLCDHSNDDRAFEGVFVSPELHHAVDVGYKIVQLYEVWHWKKNKVGLFSEYIDKFLKEKTEASGWAASCITDEQKDTYLADVKRRERIALDKSKMESNPGRKAVAEIMLNSFWGKFGQRDSLPQTRFFYKPKEYFDLCRSERHEIL